MATRTAVYFVVLVLALSGASARRDLLTKFTSGAECKVTGLAGKYSYSQDAYAKAVTKVVLKGCSVIDENVDVKAVIRAFAESCKEWAQVTVDVYAFAFGKCTVFGGSTGCAAARAHADKYASAQLEAFAKATVKAANLCPGCDPVVFTQATSNLLVEITAQAVAQAHINEFCITGDGTKVAKAYKECWAQATAWAAATSLAKAMIRGNCIGLKAHAKVLTYLEINTQPKLCACEGWRSQGAGKEPMWFDEKKHCSFHEYAVL